MSTQLHPCPPPSLTFAAAERNVCSIIDTIVQGGGYAQFSMVLSILLSQHNVLTLQDLGHPSLPTLDLLLALEKKVNTFVNLYLATHDIVSLRDLEVEVVQLLRSFNIPTLSELKQSMTTDKNEVDIEYPLEADDVVGNQASEKSSAPSSSSASSPPLPSVFSFQKYGIGQLQKHPFIIHHLPVTLKRQLGACEVYKLFASYLDSQDSRMKYRNIDVLAFANYLCKNVNVELLAETGIIFTSNNLQHDDLILRHVLREKSKSTAVNNITESPSVDAIIRQDLQTQSLEQEMESRKRLKENGNDGSMEQLIKRRAQRSTFNDDVGEINSSSSPLCKVEVEIFRPSNLTVKTQSNLHIEEKITSPKVNYMAEEIDCLNCCEYCVPHVTLQVNSCDHHAVGRWGEALVYNFLLLTRPEAEITWMNIDNESNAYYDIVMSNLPEKNRAQSLQFTRFIEVKTTKFHDKNVFQISPWEYEFLCKHPRPKYDIYRVYGAPTQPRIVIYEDVFQLIQEKEISLCLAV